MLLSLRQQTIANKQIPKSNIVCNQEEQNTNYTERKEKVELRRKSFFIKSWSKKYGQYAWCINSGFKEIVIFFQ